MEHPIPRWSNVGFVEPYFEHLQVQSGKIWGETLKAIIHFGDLVPEYLDNYPEILIKDLLWCRKYHLMLIKEIEDKLKELSKKHEIPIVLE